MKTSATAITNTSRAVSIMLSLLCAALLALSLGGCADTYSYSAPEARYNTYHAPYYYPYYRWYSYYGGAYYYGVILKFFFGLLKKARELIFPQCSQCVAAVTA